MAPFWVVSLVSFAKVNNFVAVSNSRNLLRKVLIIWTHSFQSTDVYWMHIRLNAGYFFSVLPLIPALSTQSLIFLIEPFAFLVIYLCHRKRASSLGWCEMFLKTTQCAFLCDDGGQMWFFQWVLFCLLIYVFFRLQSAVWNKINKDIHFS